ncbi:MAG: hypothetical protein KAG53_07490 [Endozoicomonadaceae bacterium]|nr:hypothetical protein [Endozoicomonadaceae bacterium]
MTYSTTFDHQPLHGAYMGGQGDPNLGAAPRTRGAHRWRTAHNSFSIRADLTAFANNVKSKALALWNWIISVLDRIKSLLTCVDDSHTDHKQPSHKYTQKKVQVHKIFRTSIDTALPTTPARRYCVWNNPPERLYSNKFIYQKPAILTTMRTVGGVGTAANMISKEQTFDPTFHKIGVVVAANHGLPLGGLADSDGLKRIITSQTLRLTTQEETLMANCIMTACGKYFTKQQAWAQKNVIKKWGLIQPVNSSTDTRTIQGIDYTTSTDSRDYDDAWIVKNVKLSAVNCHRKLQPNPVTVDLIFSAGPNANAGIGFATGSMQRTLNKKAINDYSFFRECVKNSVRVAIDGAADAGDTHVFLARTSSGVYSGDHQTQIRNDFDTIVNEVLDEKVGWMQRRNHFAQVIISDI